MLYFWAPMIVRFPVPAAAAAAVVDHGSAKKYSGEAMKWRSRMDPGGAIAPKN